MANLKIDDKALQLISDFYEIGGGAQVVTELPEVGEEHTIYELQETKVPQSLVPMFNQQMRDDSVLGDIDFCFVFTTSEEMNSVFSSIVPEEESGDIYLNYITDEDKLIGVVYEKGAWKVTEARKVSNCKFDVGAIFELEDNAYEVILKEYVGEVQGGIGYHGVLFNDEPYVFEPKTNGILLGTPTIGGMEMCACLEEFPEIPPQVPTEYIFETIPYEEIINHQLFDGSNWIFTPKSDGVTVTSYWIYTNDTWINIDEIDTNPSLHKTVFGTLTHTDGDVSLQCSLTLEEMASAIAQGNFVVLELNMGDELKENYYYCAVDEVTVGGEGPDSVEIIATWSFEQGSIEWNPIIGAFVFNNGIM